MRTGRQGIFPSAYAVDMDYSDFDPTAPKVKRERYLLGYLGSVETLSHKGTSVVCQAVRRIVGDSSNHTPDSQSCILEVSDQGLRMVNRSKPPVSCFFLDSIQVVGIFENDNFVCVFFLIEKSRPMSRLFLLAEERLVLRVSSTRSSIPRLHHETSDFAEVRLSRIHWTGLHSSCR